MATAGIAGILPARRLGLGGYAAWIAVLIAVYYVFGGLRTEAWGLISVSGVAAIVTGVIVHRPARRAPWLLLAAALASFATGQVSFLIAGQLRVALPYPSFADGFYLACYPLYAAGLAGFIRWRTPHGDRRSLIDALTLTAGLALLSWTFLIAPYVSAPGLSGLQRSVSVAYPLGDMLMLALLARLLAPGTGGARCVQLLTLGAVGVLASDAAYGLLELHGAFRNGTPVDLGWALFYSCWGAAALHPSMTRLTEPVPGQQATVSPARLAVLMLASLIAPVVLLTALPGRPSRDVSVVAVFSAVLYLLVLSRLWDAAASHRRALARELAVRQAGLALVAAADVPQVAVTVRDTVRTLLGNRAQGDALLGVRDGGTLRTAGLRPGEPDRLAEAWRPLVAEAAGPVLVPMRQLPEQARAARPGAGWMLLCPLTSGGERGGDPVGLIAVFADRLSLAGLTATMEILAHQAAMTLRSVMLRQVVIQQRNEAYFRALVQDASDAIVIVAADGSVKYATPSAAVIFGEVPAEGTWFWELFPDGDRDELARVFGQLGQIPGSRSLNRRITRPDGRAVYIQARCSDLRADPSVSGLVFTLRDVTEQHELEEQLRYKAFHDELTGLANRVLFQDRVASRLTSAARDGTAAGVLFIDLDDFKLVNDTLGHAAGDELLVAVARRLAGVLRESDTAARLGGDEFALLIGHAAGDDGVEAAAERVIAAFTEPFLLSEGLVTTSAAIGIATTGDSSTTSELLRHADLALYAAKAAGKRQWRRYQEVLSAGLDKRRELREAIETACRTCGFAVAYQPIYRLATGRLAGFEALLRWPHPQWGMLLPGQFIGLAEETGQIVPIGAWILDRAAADLARWQAPAGPAGSAGLYVSVNVAARQFADPGFAGTVRRVLDASGLDPASLVLELTETALLPSGGALIADLAALRATGVRLAIDDFGTGYSSLSYLQELPVDIIKMDKSFVDGIADGPRQLALARGIVRLAADLDFEVIAEGIETEAQRELLTSMGCHYGQGYLMARPMPPNQAGELAQAVSESREQA